MSFRLISRTFPGLKRGIRQMSAIPYSKPSLTKSENAAVANVMLSGRLTQGPKVKQFENKIAELTGSKHAVAVTSGTSALHLSLYAAGVGPGWKVLVPSYTWVATYNVPLMLGAEVIVVDVDPETFTMSENHANMLMKEEKMKNAKICLLPVHLFGYHAGEWIYNFTKKHNITLIGDGCCAFGGVWKDGKMCGTWAPVECLSFHPRKVITTGEGGMVLTNDTNIATRLKSLRDHGAYRSDEQRRQTMEGGVMVPFFAEAGFNFRMTEMQAAIGCSQMERVHEFMAKRKYIAKRYDEEFSKLKKNSNRLKWLLLPPGEKDSGRVLTFYVTKVCLPSGKLPRTDQEIQVCAKYREKIMKELSSNLGVVVRPPMTSLADCEYVMKEQNPNHDFNGARVLSNITMALPLFTDMTDEQLETVISAIGSVEDIIPHEKTIQ